MPMKIRNLLLGCSLALAALPSMAADYPEKLYLVGTMNAWTLPANGKLVEIPSVDDGIYSATLNIEAPAYDENAPISFKIFNTLASDWMDATQYYGAMSPDNNCSIYKDSPAKWTLAPGYGSSDIRIPNASSLSDAEITINLKENYVTISAPDAPEAPQELFLVHGGEDGVKYPLQRVGDTSEFKGSVTLNPGAQRLAITGSNDFLLGSNDQIYYFWKDRPANFIMMADSHDPFIIGNWIGGELEVTVNINNSMVSFNSPEQPSFPKTINLVIKGEDGSDTTFPIEAFETEYHFMTFSYTIENWQNDMQFSIEVPGVGTLKTNNDPIELWKNRWESVTVGPDCDNLVTISNWAGGDLTIQLNEYLSSVSMVSSTQPLPEQHLYLIGSPQGWKIEDDSMELTQIDNSVFTGEFDLPEKPYFRFYTSLGDWNSNSIGSQENDLPIEVELEKGKELNVNMVYGKGTWNFAGFPGGKVYMVVDLNKMKATFSTSPISGAEMVETEIVNISTVDGGIEISAPQGNETVVYDITGKIVGKAVGSCRISLLPGLYIANKEKIMVR